MDPILILMDQFRNDPRSDKIDLGVGVYRNSDGVTPVMRAVKTAEHQLWQTQETKGYTTLLGDPAFVSAIADLVLGTDVAPDRQTGVATVGGTGAIRQGLELIRLARPDVQVHIPDPSWPNHAAILSEMGIPSKTYRYFDAATGGLDFPGMLADLRAIPAGDVVLLHGCCHNPTGVDPNPTQWGEIANTLSATGATVFVDLAYLGFAGGLDADAAPTRLLAAQLPELLVAVSCSKNFGLYRDRAGVLLSITETTAQRDLVRGNLATLNRLAYSFPADHGAALVQIILTDTTLRSSWADELTDMRQRVNDLRAALATALQAETHSDRFAFIGAQNGMFSRLGITPDQVETLARDHAVYMVGDSRMNIAGLSLDDIPRLARSIALTCT